MSKTQARIRSISQKSGIEATVVSVMAKRANVRLANGGRVLHGVRVVGGPVNAGDRVSIGWQDGIPYIAAAGAQDISVGGNLNVNYNIPPGGGGDTPPGALDPLSAAGWTIVQDTGVIYKNNIYIDPAGHIKLGTADDNYAQISAADATYRFWAGKLTAASAPFSIDKAGAIKAASGTIAGWTLSASRIYNTNVYIDNTGQYIAIGATVPTVYGNNVGVWLGYVGGDSKAKLSIYNDANNYLQWDGTKLLVKAVNFTLDASGNITASSATISGSITASSGAIGGWTIAASSITSDNISLVSGANPYIRAGAKTSYGDANTGFWVGSDAGTYKLHIGSTSSYARWTGTEFQVSGNLTATTGTIGGFTLAASSLSATGIKLESGSNPAIELGLATEYMTGEGIWMGKNTSSNYSMHIGNPLNSYMDYDAGTGKMHVQSIVTVTQEVIATIGGRIIVAPSTILTSNLGNTQSNLVANPGFETSGGGGADVFANWAENAGTGTITKDGTIYHDGLASCKLTAGGSADTYVTQDFSVVASTPYSIVFWTRGNGTQAGRYGVYDVTHSTWLVAITTTGVSAATWTRFMTVVTPTSGTTTLRIYLQCPTMSVAYAHFDAVMISQDQMSVKHNEMASGDFAYLSSGSSVEWVKVLSSPSGGGPYTYYIQRDQAGAGLVSFTKGDPVVNTGQVGDGFMDMYAVNSIRAGTQLGPTIQGIARPTGGTLYSDMSEHWAIGNLRGLYNYGANTVWGAAFGRYKLSTFDTFITIDATNGFRIQHKLDSDVTYTVGQWFMDGSLVLGSTTWGTNKANVKWNSSNQRLEFRGGSDGTTVASYIDTDGSFNINVGATATKPVMINWMESTNRIAYVGTYKYAGPPNQSHLAIAVESVTSYESVITVDTTTITTGNAAIINITAQSADYSTNQAYINIYGGKTGSGNEPYIKINAGNPYGTIYLEALVHLIKNDVRISDGLHVGSPTNAVDPDSYSISYSGNLQSYKNSTKYTGYIYVPLETPATSTIFAGGTFSDVGSSTEWDLYDDFSPAIPLYAKGVVLQAIAKDTVSSLTDGLYFCAGPTTTYWYEFGVRPPGVVNNENLGPVSCSLDASKHPTLWYRINASGPSTMTITCRIWGYFI